MTKLKITEPRIEHHSEKHYVAIEKDLTREEIPNILPLLIPELFRWLEKNKIKPAGPPFFSYSKMKGKQMQVKIGILTDSFVPSDDRIKSGSFPEGNYLVATYKGDYGNLCLVHSQLEGWSIKNGIKLKGPPAEFYPSDPDIETNPDKWITIITNKILEKQSSCHFKHM